MNSNQTPDRLTELLHEARPDVGIPSGFAQAVWHRIANAESSRETSRGWLERLVGLLSEPRWAMGAAALLLAAGIILGAFEGSHQRQELARDRYVSTVNPSAAR
jgi:hypothetical protein